MRFLILVIALILSFQLSAKKEPKWKDGNFKTTSSGLQYKIVKEGKGDSIRAKDSVVVKYVWYRQSDKKELFSSEKFLTGTQSFIIGDEATMPGFEEGIKMMKKNGCGYFIIPPAIGFLYGREGEDTALYFIQICKVFHDYSEMHPVISNPQNDSINVAIQDPQKKYFGDTLFSLMKLLEQPQMAACGTLKITVAFKFELTFIDNGVQHKDILVFVECPDLYGKDYFVAGGNYMVTCIPFYDDLKNGSRTMNSYSMEKLDRYYGLRIRKM